MRERAMDSRVFRNDSEIGVKVGWSLAVLASWTQVIREMTCSANARMVGNERKPRIVLIVDLREVRAKPGRDLGPVPLARDAGRGLVEQVLVGLDLLQRGEPAAARRGELLLQQVEQHPRGFGRGAEAHVLRVGVQDEGDVVRQVHPVAVHRGDQLHEAVQEAVQGRALQGVAQRDVVAGLVEAREAVPEQGEERVGAGQDDHGPAVRLVQRRVQGEDLPVRVGAVEELHPGSDPPRGAAARARRGGGSPARPGSRACRGRPGR